MTVADYRVALTSEDEHESGFHDEAPSEACSSCRKVWCPLCTRRRKPPHQPLCFECATNSAACAEAHRLGLIP